MTTQDIPILLLLVAVIAGPIAFSILRHVFVVTEGSAGLLYRNGKLVAQLAPGRHVRWGANFRLVQMEARRTLLAVAGQEVLSADNIGVKLSVVLTVQVVDAAKATVTADNYTTHIYSAAQTATRAVIAGVTLEALLAQRVAIGSQIREIVAPQAAELGVQLHAVEVRDVMLPGELRKAFSEALKARQDGQATLERARAESAALRNLANAARLLEGHPGLATLRFLQTLESTDSKQTLVMSDLSALLPSLAARSRAAADDGEAT
jgi:regulator of protease activity HflC (stomatin/prohibitin superfamily)